MIKKPDNSCGDPDCELQHDLRGTCPLTFAAAVIQGRAARRIARRRRITDAIFLWSLALAILASLGYIGLQLYRILNVFVYF